MWDIILEICRASVMGIFFSYLLFTGRRQGIGQHEGWSYIIFGFLLIFFGMVIDITDNFPSLNRFILIGDTIYEAILEKVIGYLFGFMFIAIGFIKWMPTIVSLKETKIMLAKSSEELKILNEQLQKDIAEHEKTEKALLNAAQQWRATFDGINDIISLLDMEGRILRCNKAMVHITGKSFEEILNRPYWEIIYGENESIEDCPVIRMKKSLHREMASINKDGRLFNITVDPVFDEAGCLIGSVFIMSDVTEQKKREDTLLIFEKAIETLQLGLTITDSEGRIIYTNSAEASMHGYKVEELIGKDVRILAPRELWNPMTVEQLLKMKSWKRESINIRKDGTTFPVQLLSVVATNLAGYPLGVITTCEDISERKKEEEALRESEDRYRDLVEHSQDLICTHDLEGNILSLNQAAARVLGYDREDLLKMSIRDILAPEVRDGFEGYLKEIKSVGVANGLMLVRTKMGERRILEYNTTLRTEGIHSPIVRAMAHDITEHKRAEKEIKRNYETQRVVNSILRLSLENIPLEETLNRILELILSIPWLTFESGGAIFLAEGKGEYLIMKAQNGLSPSLRDECKKVPFGKCLCGKAAIRQEIQYSSCLDEEHEVRYNGIDSHGHYCVPILFGSETLGVINIYLKEGHARDQKEEELLSSIANAIAGIIQRKRAEEENEILQEQLRQTQKMEAIGQLAGGVAHDFNNLLTVIHGYSELILRGLNEKDRFFQEIIEIKKASEHATSLTRQLLAFSRKQVLQPKILDLNSLILNMEKMLRRMIGEDIELITLLTNDPKKVKADPGQLEQVIFNLTVNARDAMPNGGRLIIETSNIELDEKYASTHIGITPGNYTVLSISDTGYGMTPDIRDRIFEPFFTTKEKGTGLGLSTVYGIVKQSGGSISVYSEPNKGTTFNVYLPVVKEITEAHGFSLNSKRELRGSEMILLVEDEEAVRKLIHEILCSYGYKVLEAANGEEALRIVREKPPKTIHLMLSDVVMPGMSGPELADSLKSFQPGIKVLFTSGYTTHTVVHNGILDKGVPYIQKPFTPEALVSKIRDVLEGTKN